jgi:hypothetical protein
VVSARSLVQLADAMETAGPEVYFKSLLGRPVFRVRWLCDSSCDEFATHQFHPLGTEDQQNAEVQWQVWQLRVLHVMQDLWAAIKSVGIAPSAAAVTEPAAAAAASTSAAASEAQAGMLLQTLRKEAAAAAAAAAVAVTASAVAPASRSSGTTCCACCSAARSGQQQRQRMMPFSQIGKSLQLGHCPALLQKRSSTASSVQKQ